MKANAVIRESFRQTREYVQVVADRDALIAKVGRAVLEHDYSDNPAGVAPTLNVLIAKGRKAYAAACARIAELEKENANA